MNLTSLHIRWMINRDVPEFLAIEDQSFGKLAWDEDDLKRCLRRRDYIGMVVERDERVVGHMIYELKPKRLNLLRLAVHVQHRRSGVGRAMIEKLVGKLCPSRRHMIEVRVRESSLEALQFFKAMGFRAISLCRDYFRSPKEDAIAMVLRHPSLVSSS